MDLSPFKLSQGNISFNTPLKHMLLKVSLQLPDFPPKGTQKIPHQFFLVQELIQMMVPIQPQLRIDNGARVPQYENNGHARKIYMHPLQEEVGTDILYQSFGRDEPR